MARRKRYGLYAVSVVAAAALVFALTPTSWADPHLDVTPDQQRALDAGMQIAPKGDPTAKLASNSPNPYLGNLPNVKSADYSTWKQRLATGRQRAKSAALAANRTRALGRAPAAAFVHDEQEPAGNNGSNDTQVNAEPVTGFGTGRRENPRVRILGSIAKLAPAATQIKTRNEDNGSIPLSTRTRIDGEGAVTTESRLGDGPYGGPNGSNDFDFFALSSQQGLTISVDTLGTATTDTFGGDLQRRRRASGCQRRRLHRAQRVSQPTDVPRPDRRGLLRAGRRFQLGRVATGGSQRLQQRRRRRRPRRLHTVNRVVAD